MRDWTAGYVADIGYTFGYYGELNPMNLKLAFLNAGLAIPEVATACELGFGQGLSANLHAAATITQWYGTDFNPSQAGYAQELAAVSGSGAKLYDEAFAEFAARSDIPDFDYIGLHGIWSWISDENREVIVEFIRRKLRVGGVLYVSYNTLPGWAAFAPMRHLMTEHAEVLGSEGGGIVSRIDGAVEFAEKLLATNPAFGRANPLVGERLKKLKEQNRHYLAHEYFNRDWHPMHFATMAEWLSNAKVQFACSAHYLDHIDAVNLTVEQQEFLKAIPDAMFRETTRDFMVNQQFRRDYWVKGVRRLTPLDQSEKLRQERLVLVTPRQDISLKATGALGQADLNEAVYVPLLDLMADHKVRTLGQIEAELRPIGLQFSQLMQASMILVGCSYMSLVQDDATQSKARKVCDRINEHLMLKARSNSDVSYLASPVTGGGVPLSRFNQLFLLAYKRGQRQVDEMAAFVWKLLQLQGQKIVKEGMALGTEEENLAELKSQANVFSAKNLPVLKALMLV